MADKPKQNEAAPAAPAEKKKLPLKTILIVAAALLVEAGAITAVFVFAGGPAKVQAEGAAADAAALAEQPVEVLVIADKFQNTRTGRTYLYDTEIYIVAKRKDEAAVKAALEVKKAQINADVSTIFRRAEPAHLLEPTLATLSRQVKAALDQRLGHGAVDAAASPVQEVLITKCTQIRVDN